MEEMTEVELDGRRFLWDGTSWCDAKTYMEPPDNVINKLNETYRKHEVTQSRPSPMLRGRSPRKASAPRFVPAAKAPTPPKSPPAPPKPVEKLTRYEGEHAFLSVDSPATVYLDGQAFPSVALA